MRLAIYLLTLSVSPAVLARPSVATHGIKCGAKGYTDGTDSYYYSKKTGTYAACSSVCQKDADCLSFAVGSGECQLFDVAVVDNFEEDDSSPYAFYDASCISASTSASKTSTSTTANVKSTTTQGSKTSSTQTTKTATTTTARSKMSTSTAPTTSTSAKSTTTSTTSKTKSTTTTTTSSSASSTPPCPYPTWTITNFRFINSSHNLDCAGSDSGNNLCYTGLPPQPAGYGPPDSIWADITQIGSCAQQNPGSVPRREIGDGNVVRCAGSQIQFEFHGDSRTAKSTPLFALQNTVECPDGASSYRAYGQGTLAMTCSYDAGKNATCLLDGGSGSVVATSFTM